MCKFIRHLNGDSLIAAKEDEYLSFYMQLDALTRKPPLTHLISLKREIMLPVYGPVIITVTEAASNLTHISNGTAVLKIAVHCFQLQQRARLQIRHTDTYSTSGCRILG